MGAGGGLDVALPGRFSGQGFALMLGRWACANCCSGLQMAGVYSNIRNENWHVLWDPNVKQTERVRELVVVGL